jgi:hypothetical protein
MKKIILAVVLLVLIGGAGAEVAYVTWQLNTPAREDWAQKQKNSIVFKGESLSKWDEKLKSHDVAVRRGAATAMIEIPPKDGQYLVGVLCNAISDEDKLTRCRAGAALSHILSGVSIPAPLNTILKPEPLIEVLNDPDPSVRDEAVRALGSFGPRLGMAVPTLTYLSKNGKSEDTRKAAASALEKIQPPDKSPEAKPLRKEGGKTDTKASDAKGKEEKGNERKGTDPKGP